MSFKPLYKTESKKSRRSQKNSTRMQVTTK